VRPLILIRFAPLLVLAAVLLAGCSRAEVVGRELPEPRFSPRPVVAVPTSTPTPATPAPVPEPTVDADAERLAELRAGGDYLILAEYERASQEAMSHVYGVGALLDRAPDGAVVHQWTNRPELWDSFAPAFRDACLAGGPAHPDPILDAALPINASQAAIWSDTSTGGRGRFVQMRCVASGPDGPIALFSGVLIVTDADGAGHAAAIMPLDTIRVADFGGIDDLHDFVRVRQWDWIQAQPAPRGTDSGDT
jgi:hypothetical protein